MTSDAGEATPEWPGVPRPRGAGRGGAASGVRLMGQRRDEGSGERVHAEPRFRNAPFAMG